MQLARFADAVGIAVDPHIELTESGILAVDDAVVVGIELSQGIVAVGRFLLASVVPEPNSSEPLSMLPLPLRSMTSKPSPPPTQPVFDLLPVSSTSNCTPAPKPRVWIPLPFRSSMSGVLIER